MHSGDTESPDFRLTELEMRQLGYRAVDAVVTHFTDLRDRPVGRRFDRGELENRLGQDFPKGPTSPPDVFRDIIEHVLSGIVHTDHPRFLAYVPGPSNFVSAVSDFLAAGFNVFAGHWISGSAPAVIEKTTIDWVCRQVGFPPESGGLFVSGGSIANLVGVHAARSARLGKHDPSAIVYVTEHTHASLLRGLRVLSFHGSQARQVPLDENFALDVARLAEQIEIDRRRKARPFCVIATAGTTSTGTVDSLVRMADICEREGLWLHVDGAYGAAAIVTERGRRVLAGLERADSIALDPHKWWFQPYEIGCVLVRNRASLVDAFTLHAEYLRETRLGTGPINYYDYGPQLTRAFRALKLWASLRTLGTDALARAIERGIALADFSQATLLARGGWNVVSPAQLGIVTFRPLIPGWEARQIDDLTTRLAVRTLDDGYAVVTTTEIAGRPVLRFCTIHPETSQADIVAVIDRLERLAADLAGNGEEKFT
jgi:aromatic-L-amino-acid/L-tryptophan decarboxylase